MRIDHAITTVIVAERDLAGHLERLAGRHADEHDVHHLAHSQARKARTRADSLTDAARRYGAREPRQPDPEPGVMDTVRRRAGDLMGRSAAPAVVFLDDLQEVYLVAQRAEIAWVVLLQGAKALRDGGLVEVGTTAHEACETTAKWLRTRIKVAAPQILATG